MSRAVRRLAHRVLGALSRRLGRPELLALTDRGARQAQREAVAISAILAAALDDSSTYVDVGTNRGQVLGEAVRAAPRAEHIAFEPIPALAAELARAFPAVDCRRVAVAAAPGEAQFCHFTRLDGWSGLRRSPEISDERGRPEYITVALSTLDAELQGRTPTVVKIDVEGAELAVVEGGRATIARARPLIVFEHVAAAATLYDASSEMLWDLLGELDYVIFSVAGEGPFTREAFAAGGDVVNWLARPRERA